MKTYLDKINEKLDAFEFGSTPKELYEPIRYILSLGGKKLRPVLALMAYKVFKPDYEQIIYPALSIEVFHNFSLMHDDIMDAVPLRRGKATVHEKWNSNVAILSGDVMLVKAYGLLAKTDTAYLPQVLQLFNTCAAEVCEGQQLDMNFENRSAVAVEEYIEMIRLKTAVLLGFALELGAVLAGASQNDAQKLREFGQLIGIGFQLKDDLLDVYGDADKFGKQVGGDILCNKKTFLLIQALQKGGQEEKELCEWLEISNKPEEKVQAVKAIYTKLHVKEATEAAITDYFNKGLNALEEVAGDTSELKQFALDLMQRDR